MRASIVSKRNIGGEAEKPPWGMPSDGGYGWALRSREGGAEGWAGAVMDHGAKSGDPAAFAAGSPLKCAKIAHRLLLFKIL